ncbi:hypothetical protein [Kitasatospora sp. NBC_00458]|uniref:hypothetical protein n=1 Tax=Kitasatospora sp. NBC_00458 TaxID=2903568 RepID=UPI002E19008E
MPSRRVLKLTFEFHVPEGLDTNIRSARVDSATDQIVGAVRELAPEAFPWADELTVHREWSYRWLERRPETLPLPATDKNTAPKSAPDHDGGADEGGAAATDEAAPDA